jgi:hypothetical protein
MNIAPPTQVSVHEINGKSVTLLWVVPTHCVACKKSFNDELACAIGPPYNCLIHASCLPYYDFQDEWPHNKSFLAYRRNSWAPKN